MQNKVTVQKLKLSLKPSLKLKFKQQVKSPCNFVIHNVTSFTITARHYGCISDIRCWCVDCILFDIAMKCLLNLLCLQLISSIGVNSKYKENVSTQHITFEIKIKTGHRLV